LDHTHVYEVVGEVLFRRSGHRSNILQCKIVRTRVLSAAEEKNSLWTVSISEIMSGYGVYVFSTWFDDWGAGDNLYKPDFESGRPIDVAIPIDIFNEIVTTGRLRETATSTAIRLMLPEDKQPYSQPVVAVRIGGRWVEPLGRPWERLA
jgi:hypothetical protein